MAMGILPEKSKFEETSGSALLTGGINKIEKILNSIKDSKVGGVIFVDESYQLSPHDDRTGRQILDFILLNSERLETTYGRIVWIFAGYTKHMEKLFEHNPGLPSRFPIEFKFDDYNDIELIEIFNILLKTRGQGFSSNISVSLEEPASKPVVVPISSSRFSEAYYQSKSDEIDEWGNTWRWNTSSFTFEDAYDNITGIGAKGLGSITNPIMSRNGNIVWLYDRYKKKFYRQDDPKVSRTVYPGMPMPIADNRQSEIDSSFTVTDEKWVRVAIGRLGRCRNKVGFGNARAVKNLFDKCRQRQSTRVTSLRNLGYSPNIMEMDRNDLLGPKADRDILSSLPEWKELLHMEGLLEVKDEIKKLIDLVCSNAEREDHEKPMLQINLNRVFLGNPGTGKVNIFNSYYNIVMFQCV